MRNALNVMVFIFIQLLIYINEVVLDWFELQHLFVRATSVTTLGIEGCVVMDLQNKIGSHVMP